MSPTQIHQVKVVSAEWKHVFALLLLLLTAVGCQSFSQYKTQGFGSETFSKDPPQRLVIGLDGVSYQLITKMYEGGHFRQFEQASPMVATFPSISDPNWNRLMGTDTSDGYTKSHFDPRPKRGGDRYGKVLGSLIDHLTEEMNYEHTFDFKAKGFIEHFASLTWIETSALYWLDALERELFKTSGRHTYFAFIVNTDLLSHTSGEPALMGFLSSFDKRIKLLRDRFKDRYKQELEVVLVSDHGNSYSTPIRMIGANANLRKRGWVPKESLGGPREFVFVAPEILSFGAFYCAEKDSRPLARDLSGIEGVHLAAYVSKSHEITLLTDYGRSAAVISVSPLHRRLSYKVLAGQDPLGTTARFFEGVQDRSFDEYFQWSVTNDYPYAAVRLWEGFYLNSRFPGQVLVSARVGFAFENPMLKILTDLRGLTSMHGSLHHDESLGVVMSTHGVQGPLRPEEFAAEYVVPYRAHSQLALVKLFR